MPSTLLGPRIQHGDYGEVLTLTDLTPDCRSQPPPKDIQVVCAPSSPGGVCWGPDQQEAEPAVIFACSVQSAGFMTAPASHLLRPQSGYLWCLGTGAKETASHREREPQE